MVHCRDVAFPINYHEVMLRYKFRTPGKRGGMDREAWHERCRVHINVWIELLIAEKRRQMRAADELWPA